MCVPKCQPAGNECVTGPTKPCCEVRVDERFAKDSSLFWYYCVKCLYVLIINTAMVCISRRRSRMETHWYRLACPINKTYCTVASPLEPPAPLMHSAVEAMSVWMFSEARSWKQRSALEDARLPVKLVEVILNVVEEAM